jgi:hypothetical protein
VEDVIVGSGGASDVYLDGWYHSLELDRVVVSSGTIYTTGCLLLASINSNDVMARDLFI